MLSNYRTNSRSVSYTHLKSSIILCLILQPLEKIIGGGLPAGAYGGKSKIMDFVAPDGPVYQAGTLSGNPLAMSAGLSVLVQLNDNLYRRLERISSKIENGINDNIKKLLSKQAILSLPETMFTPKSNKIIKKHIRIAFANINKSEINELFERLKDFKH